MTDNEMQRLYMSQCASGDYCMGYNRAVDEANVIITRQKAEIERLEEEIELLHSDYTYKFVKAKAKAEAYKEFAERLKAKHRRITDYDEAGFGCQIFIVEEHYIDKILKEKIGE